MKSRSPVSRNTGLREETHPTMQDTAARQKIFASSGYAKIENAAKLARSLGLRFWWVDTCCIDKTSSAELSESINSMYCWYRDAKFCIAYLSNVEPAAISELSAHNSNFRRSRWFTRGWTLQELVAPKKSCSMLKTGPTSWPKSQCSAARHHVHSWQK